MNVVWTIGWFPVLYEKTNRKNGDCKIREEMGKIGEFDLFRFNFPNSSRYWCVSIFLTVRSVLYIYIHNVYAWQSNYEVGVSLVEVLAAENTVVYAWFQRSRIWHRCPVTIPLKWHFLGKLWQLTWVVVCHPIVRNSSSVTDVGQPELASTIYVVQLAFSLQHQCPRGLE